MNLIFYTPRQRIWPDRHDGETGRAPLLAAGLYCFEGTNVKLPPDRNLTNELTGTMDSLGIVAPQQLSMEQQYQPAYENLNLSLLANAMPTLSSLTAGSESAGRGADISDLARFGPDALAALKAANPSQAALLDQISGSASTNLAAGANLTPAQQRQAQQYMRTGQAARGMGMGPSDALGETLGEQQFGQSLLGQRQGFATQAAGLTQSAQMDPLMQLLTRLRGSGVQQGQSIMGSSGPRLFDPMNSYAQDLYNTNFNAQAAQGMQNASTSSAEWSGLLGGGAKVAGGGMGAI